MLGQVKDHWALLLLLLDLRQICKLLIVRDILDISPLRGGLGEGRLALLLVEVLGQTSYRGLRGLPVEELAGKN